METKQIMSLALAIAIGALVFSAALIPAISMATDTEDTFTNEGLRYIKATSEDTYTLVWDPATPGKATVNDEDYTIWSPGDGNKSISIVMVPDSGIVRYNINSSGVIIAIQIVGLGVLSVTDGFSLTYESGTYSITNGTQTITGTSDNIYAIGNGEYVLKNPNDRSFLIEDSEVFGMGVTTVLAWNNGFQIEGDNFQIDGDTDNIEVSTFNEGSSTFVITNVADDLTVVNNYVDLYTLNKVTFTVTGTPTEGDPVTVNATYSYFLVPYEVTAELTIHADGPTRAILGMIPIIAVLGLLVGIVTIGYMKFRN